MPRYQRVMCRCELHDKAKRISINQYHKHEEQVIVMERYRRAARQIALHKRLGCTTSCTTRQVAQHVISQAPEGMSNDGQPPHWLHRPFFQESLPESDRKSVNYDQLAWWNICFMTKRSDLDKFRLCVPRCRSCKCCTRGESIVSP